ncbi:hypothetical protein CDAR_291611 [Caerostris darwini]|uniref:Uncharacterized protein n=1 Tax=Caerostris darwini TaxID=1538125 RepID=A0AAV4VFJ9_9ARAC|nr:hypothetical protein CDAR_291611 [Caerostris darwini]
MYHIKPKQQERAILCLYHSRKCEIPTDWYHNKIRSQASQQRYMVYTMSFQLRERGNRSTRKTLLIGAETRMLPCTSSNAHLGRKNERLMRQRNIKRVLGTVPRRAPTESVNPHLEQLAMIRSSRKFVNFRLSGQPGSRNCSGERFERNLR